MLYHCRQQTIERKFKITKELPFTMTNGLLCQHLRRVGDPNFADYWKPTVIIFSKIVGNTWLDGHV